MSEDTDNSVTEIADYRYRSAERAREGMRTDLVVLANNAIRNLHEQPISYSETVPAVNQKAWSPTEATFRQVNTWDIPNTQYFLPDWQQEIHGDDFFETSLEYTFVRQTDEGLEVISFETFVKECTRAEYIAVCEGLSDLCNLRLQAVSKTGGDGQEN